jgi:hypothetical protein
LWLIKVWFSASTFVVKIATFAKPKNVAICVMTLADRLAVKLKNSPADGQRFGWRKFLMEKPNLVSRVYE